LQLPCKAKITARRPDTEMVMVRWCCCPEWSDEIINEVATMFGSQAVTQQGCNPPVVVLDHGARADVRRMSTNRKEKRWNLAYCSPARCDGHGMRNRGGRRRAVTSTQLGDEDGLRVWGGFAKEEGPCGRCLTRAGRSTVEAEPTRRTSRSRVAQLLGHARITWEDGGEFVDAEEPLGRCGAR
jgi:hypothetical protein